MIQLPGFLEEEIHILMEDEIQILKELKLKPRTSDFLYCPFWLFSVYKWRLKKTKLNKP